MTTFYSPFGNQIGASEGGYQAIPVAPNQPAIQLLWAVNGDIDATQINSQYVVADLTILFEPAGQATQAYRVNLPPTTSVSVGQAFIVQNGCAQASVAVYASATDTVAISSAAPGQALRLTVSNNVTVAATSWSALTIGVGQIAINTAAIAGPSLGSLNNQLVVSPTSFRMNSPAYAPNATHRGGYLTQAAGYSGAISMFLPAAVDGYYFYLGNTSTGVITITPPTGVLIDNAASVSLNPNESCTVVAVVTTVSGAAVPSYFTISRNRNPIFQFQQLTTMLTAANNWAATIPGTEPATILDFVVVGSPGSVVPTVTLPNTKQLWLIRGIGGSNQSISYTVSGGNTLMIATSGQTQASSASFTPVVTNGINVIYAMGGGGGTPVGGSTFVAAAGSAANPSYTFQNDDSGFFQVADGIIGISANGVQVGKIDSNGIFASVVDGGEVL